MINLCLFSFFLCHNDKHFYIVLQALENEQKGKAETLCDTVKNPEAFQDLALHEREFIYLISQLDSTSLI